MSQAVAQLSDLERTDIAALGAFVIAQINAHRQSILGRENTVLERLFASEGDAAYGVFRKHLFALLSHASRG